jgi:Tfp pilus assembly protein PilO
MIVKILLFPLAIILVLYFVIAKVVPSAQAITVTKEAIVQAEEKLVDAQNQLQQVHDFKQTIEEHPKEVAYVADFVPNNQREEILLSDISQLADDNNISLFSVSFTGNNQKTSNNTDVKFIGANLVASGSYEDFKRFTHQLFRIKRLYDFKTIDLTKSEKEIEAAIVEGEEIQPQGLNLSGNISFTYGYVPGLGEVSATTMSESINFDLINTVAQTTANTEPLVVDSSQRSNPFLP